MNKAIWLIFYLVLSLAASDKKDLTTKQDPVVNPIQLNQPIFVVKQKQLTFQYYSLQLQNLTFEANQSLIISTATDQHVFTSIYINIIQPNSSNQVTGNLPTIFKSDIQCYNTNVVSCVIFHPVINSTILIGVWGLNPFSYIISAEIQAIQSLNISDSILAVQLDEGFAQIYLLNFSASSNQIANQSELIIRGQYQISGSNIDYKIFSIVACTLSKNKTTLSNNCHRSQALGAYTQQLKLQNNNQQYYITITGQTGLTLALSTQIPSAQLQLSEVTEYIYDSSLKFKGPQISQFFYNVSENTNQNDTDYGVYVEKLAGDGIITVSACLFNLSLKMDLGYSSYVIIPQAILSCNNPLIKVKIFQQSHVQIYSIGVRIIVEPYADNIQQPDSLYLGQQRVQVFPTLSQTCYNLTVQQLQTDYQQVLLLQYSSNIPNINLTTIICEQQTTPSQKSPQCTQSIHKMQINTTSQLHLKSIQEIVDLQICTNLSNTTLQNNNYYYSLVALPYPQIKTVDLNNEVYDIVNDDETIVYMINGVQEQTNQSTLIVHVKLINGDITMYDTCVDLVSPDTHIRNLKYECKNSDDSTAWMFIVSYDLAGYNDSNPFQQIKFGIRGNSQSLYSISAYMVDDDNNTDPDPTPPGPTPIPDLALYDGANNISVPAGQTYNYTYTSHIIPYRVQIPSGQNLSNWCIEIFETQQELKNTKVCTANTDLSQNIYRSDKLYVRITNNLTGNLTNKNNSASLTIDIFTPEIILSSVYPLVISCKKVCYTNIKILNFDFKGDLENIVTISGPGYINATEGKQQNVLKFTALPFIFTANLKQAGQLFIEIGGNGPNIISKTVSSYQLQLLGQLKVIAPVTDLPSLLVNSFGRRFKASWAAYSINNSESNYFSYDYPDASNPLLESSTYASPSVPIILEDTESNNISPLCFWSAEYKCFYTITFKNGEIGIDILNTQAEIQINMNSTLDYLTLDTPQTVVTGFGVLYHRVLLLFADFQDEEDIQNKFNLTNQRVSVQPISACGSIEVDLIQADIMFGEKVGSNQKYLQVYSTQSCAYKVAITQCYLPIAFAGAPKPINLSLSTGFSTIYHTPLDAEFFQISLWKNLTFQNQQNLGQSLIISVFQVANQQNCTSSQNKLVSTTVLNLKQSIYRTVQLAKSIKIKVSESLLTPIYIINIAPATSSASAIPVTLLIKSQQSQLILPPNSQPIPLVSQNENSIVYTYYTIDNMWQFCYLISNPAGTVYNFTVDIVSNSNNISQKEVNVKVGQSEGYINVSKRQGGNHVIKYQIILKSNVNIAQSDSIWIYSKQYVQIIQTNNPHTPIYQPATSIMSSTNGKYGRCFSYDLTNLLNTVNIIFYPQIPLSRSNSPDLIPVTVQGKQLKYNKTQILSTRSNKVLSYKIMIQSTQFKETNFAACFEYPYSFFTKVIDQADDFNVIFNEQTIIKNVASQSSQIVEQIYKYVDLSLSAAKQNQWLITQVVTCQTSLSSSSITLLGSTNFYDLLLGNIAQYDRIFNNYSVIAGISSLNKTDHFYIGIKHKGSDNFVYSITTYKTNSSTLPQARWSLVNQKISCTQSEDRQDIIINIPAVTTSIPQNVSANISYTIYAIPRANSTQFSQKQKMIRCPSLYLVESNNIKIFNMTAVNPKIPLFKVNVNQLPSKNVTIIATATIRQTPDSIPIRYFYNYDNIDIQDVVQPESQHKFNLALLFVIIAISIFLVLIARLVYKIVRRRSSRNNVDFEMQVRQPQPAPVQAQPTVITSPQRPSARQSVGYNQFVDQQVAV